MLFNSRSSNRFLLGSLFALTITALAPVIFADYQANSASGQEVKLGLNGFCPVCITAGKKWVKGNPSFQATYDGVTYQFPGEEPKQKFLADPARYVPALGGDCVVCLAKAGKRMPGSLHHATYHKDRLYLFPSDKEKQMFLSNPTAFENVDLAMKGECAVCLAMMKKHMPGKPEFTAIHNGLRYQFPSDRERQIFLKEPTRYVTVKVSTFTGRSGCAACEFGVNPIGSPNELGLAVITSDGQVIVVEDAHAKWPNLYEARFDGQQFEVSGQVIHQQGKFKWIKPTSLKVVSAE